MKSSGLNVSFVDHYLYHLSGLLSDVHMLLASLISNIIPHTVFMLLTNTHANILCSDLHLAAEINAPLSNIALDSPVYL